MNREVLLHKLSGFTLVELLVVLALSSLSLTFSYGALNLTQDLFYRYKTQQRFLSEITELKKRLAYEAAEAQMIYEEQQGVYRIERDSCVLDLKLLETVVLLQMKGHTDTFHVKPEKLKVVYEEMMNPLWQHKLIKDLRFRCDFSKQGYELRLVKDWDASVKMVLEQD